MAATIMDFFLGTQERVRNSHSKRTIDVRAIKVLLYLALLSLKTYVLKTY